MKTKPLLITVCALVVIAGLASWLSSRGAADASSAARPAGAKLLTPEQLQSAREIQLLGTAGEIPVVLRRDQQGWVLPDYFGLPADFEKLSRFTRTLLDAEIDRFVTSSPESLERLELGRSAVRLLGDNGDAWELHIGNSGRAGGNFIRFAEEPSAYLTTSSILVDANQTNWALKRPISFEESDVARVELTFDGEPLTLVREEPGAVYSAEGLGDDQEVRPGEVSRLVRSLVTARFTEAMPADHEDAVAARNQAYPVTLELFDGTRYTLHIGRRPGISKPTGASGPKKGATSTSIVIDQDGQIVPPEVIAQVEAESGVAPGEEPAEPEVEEVPPGPVFIFYDSEAPGFAWGGLNDRVAFRFSDHLFTQLPSGRDQLIESRPADETGEGATGEQPAG